MDQAKLDRVNTYLQNRGDGKVHSVEYNPVTNRYRVILGVITYAEYTALMRFVDNRFPDIDMEFVRPVFSTKSKANGD